MRTRAGVPGIALVALAAALWGTDALFRRGLALELPASAVVFAEHLILVAVTAPFVVRGLRRAARSFDRGDWVALALVGAGASALATILFTAAFAYGDPTTPLLLQKLQPLFAIAGASLLLGERLTPNYVVYFLLAVAGAYLITFPDPTAVSVSALAPSLLAVGAAGLWGMGTVLGRSLSAKVGFADLTALRFAVGLPAGAVILGVRGEGASLTGIGATQVLALVLLSLVPGLFALLIYYRGLRATPAAVATLGELAFPLSAVLVNYLAFGVLLAPTQWLGLVILAGTITALSIASSDRGYEAVGVRVPDLKPGVP